MEFIYHTQIFAAVTNLFFPWSIAKEYSRLQDDELKLVRNGHSIREIAQACALWFGDRQDNASCPDDSTVLASLAGQYSSAE